MTVDDFDIVKRLGKGSFSNVFLVRKKDTRQLLAMKGKCNLFIPLLIVEIISDNRTKPFFLFSIG